jgi:predicted ester cyclase
MHRNVKTTGQWKTFIAGLPQPDGMSHYDVVASHILHNLEGYRQDARGRLRDIGDVAHALEALVQLEVEAVR